MIKSISEDELALLQEMAALSYSENGMRNEYDVGYDDFEYEFISKELETYNWNLEVL